MVNMYRLTELIKSPSFLVKIVELIVSVISTGLITDVGNIATDYNKLAVVYGTLIGFIMISIIVIAGSVSNNGLNRTLIMMISLPAAFLFFASGALMIQYWDTVDGVSDRVLGAGIVAFCNGIVYVVDLVMTFFRYG